LTEIFLRFAIPALIFTTRSRYENVNLASGGKPYWQPGGGHGEHAELVLALTKQLKESFGFATDE